MELLLEKLIAPVTQHKRGSEEYVRTNVLNESWEFGDAITDELTHNIHRYSGKFIPQIAARAIQILSDEQDTILDVFCGSGTTILEAARQGRKAVGIDLSPLAILISKVKTTSVDPDRLEQLKLSLSNTISLLDEKKPLDLFYQDVPDYKQILINNSKAMEVWYTKWYGENALRELLIIDTAIDALSDTDLKNISILSLSNILRRASRAHSGYPNVMFDKNSKDNAKPIKWFLREISLVCNQVKQLTGIKKQLAGVDVRCANSTNLPIEDNSIDAVITHPPYIGSIPYAEYGALSLKWLGVDSKVLDAELTGGKRQSKKVVERFSVDYQKILSETYRVLKRDKFLFLMVGNPVVKGELIDLTKMSREMASEAGFRCIVETSRVGVNRRANKMGAETLLFFQK